MEPWYKLALPKAEVHEGRSFNPNEFAIALEQVVAGRGPEDYRDPQKFFVRTYGPALGDIEGVSRPLRDAGLSELLRAVVSGFPGTLGTPGRSGNTVARPGLAAGGGRGRAGSRADRPRSASRGSQRF